ncbi:MAG: hypothetical protein AAGJ36_07785, partial [Pseudomonadota bacterium]
CADQATRQTPKYRAQSDADGDGLVGTLPSVGVQFEFTPAGVAALAEQLPVYVWAFVAGIGVTVAATLAER